MPKQLGQQTDRVQEDPWKSRSNIWERCSSKSGRGNTRSISDQPAENKGFDEGMTPPELLLASLGSCAAYYAVDYLVRNKIAREGVKTRVTAEKVKGPFRRGQLQDRSRRARRS